MKIALCISGQPRLVKTGFLTQNKYILEKYDVDVFIHSWYEGQETNLVECGGSYSINDDTVNEILNLYKPIKYIIEPQKRDFPQITHHFPGPPIFPQLSMFYSMMKSNDLKKQHEDENGFKYDVVIRSRFDAGLLKDLDMGIIEPNTVIGIDAIESDILCDWLFYGNSETMDKLTDVYNHVESLKTDIITFCGENLLWANKNKHNINVKKLYEGQRGEALVLIRNYEMRKGCWMSENDVLNSY